MPNQHPLNPDALSDTARVALINSARELGQEHWCLSVPAQAKKVLNDCADALAQHVVNSVEELDKLPVGTVLRDRIGWIWEIQDVGEFITTGSEYDSYSQEVNRPARVLYRPTRESTNGR